MHRSEWWEQPQEMFQDLPQLRKDTIMPGVGKMKFPYTSKGMAAAKKAAKKMGKTVKYGKGRGKGKTK